MLKSCSYAEGLQGKIVEKDLLGETKYEAMKKLKMLREKYYITVSDAIEVAKEMQSGKNPNSPEKPFALDLYNTVATKIEEKIDEDFEWEKLKYYTTVGIPSLDYNNGIDAFLELEDENGEKKIVTIDVTINPEKDSYKADEIILVPSEGIDKDIEEDKEEWDQIIEASAERIVNLMAGSKEKLQIENIKDKKTYTKRRF